MSDPTIDIRWRWDEITKEIMDATSSQQHEKIKKMIARATASGNFSEIVDAIGATVHNLKSIIEEPDYSGDHATVRAGMKKFIKAICDHCPGLERAIKKDGTIDPDYLSD